MSLGERLSLSFSYKIDVVVDKIGKGERVKVYFESMRRQELGANCTFGHPLSSDHHEHFDTSPLHNCIKTDIKAYFKKQNRYLSDIKTKEAERSCDNVPQKFRNTIYHKLDRFRTRLQNCIAVFISNLS